MLDDDKVKISCEELNDSRVDEFLAMKQQMISSKNIVKDYQSSNPDYRRLFQIGLLVLLMILGVLLIIMFLMRHYPQEPTSTKNKIYKASVFETNDPFFVNHHKFVFFI